MNAGNKLYPPGKLNVFGCPQGRLGAIAGWLMVQMSRGLNSWAVSKLDVQANDYILEVGYGPGVAVQQIAERVLVGFVAGIDPSAVMMRQASKRNSAGIKSEQIELRKGSVASLPYQDRTFDEVLSVNNIMLWPGPTEIVREVRRLMKPGGRLVIALNPRWAKTPQDIKDMGREIIEHAAAGLFPIDTEFRKLKPAGAVTVTAIVPSS